MANEVIIVGAGIAGLTCALQLQKHGIPARILEASDRPGGRVRTDEHEGFLLDCGFQVLLTAYPDTQRLLDFAALRLNLFQSGAKVWVSGKLHTVADPRRHPLVFFPTLTAPIGSLSDKLRLAYLSAELSLPPLNEALSAPEFSTEERLRRAGVSSQIIERFFRPFLGGIFLERELKTSSRKFDFVFRMFAQGSAALPSAGMGAIPAQLASRLNTPIEFGSKVIALEANTITLAEGARFTAETIVLATDPWTREALLNSGRAIPSNTVACVYFSAPTPPIRGPWLVLNGEGHGPVNNLCVPSEVHRSYAPAGQSLISASVIEPEAQAADLTDRVTQQLTGWFGKQVGRWKHLRTYVLTQPIPVQTPGSLDPIAKPPNIRDGLFTCSDADWIASIEGAVRSGTAAAEAVTQIRG